MALIDHRQFESEPPHVDSLGSVDTQEQINQFFRFDLGDHKLNDPETNKGFVSTIQELGSIRAFGRVIPVREIRIVDPYVAADPETYSRVRNHVEKMEAVLQSQSYNPLVERKQKYPYSRETDTEETRRARRQCNQFTKGWLHDENVAPLKAWHALIPSAIALGHLTDPSLDRVFDIDGKSVVTTPETAAHLRHVDDAIGIRNRAVAMEAIAAEHLGGLNKPKIEWLDLASGTAEPSISAAQKASVEQGLDISLTVVDHDPVALGFVKEVAAKKRFGGKLTIVEDFITVPGFKDNLPNKSGYDVVENLGFEEYLPERDMQDGLGSDELGAFKDIKILPNASDFTRWAYDLVNSGGVLISGNMILDRPQRDFVFGIVNWPIINARSDESILRVYKRAGILDDPNARVEIFHVTDELTNSRIYDIVKVMKIDDKQPKQKSIYVPRQALVEF